MLCITHSLVDIYWSTLVILQNQPENLSLPRYSDAAGTCTISASKFLFLVVFSLGLNSSASPTSVRGLRTTIQLIFYYHLAKICLFFHEECTDWTWKSIQNFEIEKRFGREKKKETLFWEMYKWFIHKLFPSNPYLKQANSAILKKTTKSFWTKSPPVEAKDYWRGLWGPGNY